MSLNSEAGNDADKHGETSRLFPVAVTGYSNGRTGGAGRLHDVEQPPPRFVASYGFEWEEGCPNR